MNRIEEARREAERRLEESRREVEERMAQVRGAVESELGRLPRATSVLVVLAAAAGGFALALRGLRHRRARRVPSSATGGSRRKR
jgi:hypothetical protein